MAGSSFWDKEPDVAPAPPGEEEPRVVIQPPPTLKKPPALYEFFAKQGIDAEIVDLFECGVATHDFAIGKRAAICFPFRAPKARLLGYGYRPPEGSPREWDAGAAGALFNLDSIEADPDMLWWAFDEVEAMALYATGYRNVVASPCDLDTALRDNADLLSTPKEIVLALPDTEAGRKLTDDLAARLGRHRVSTVTWPDGCRCAADVARMHGLERLQGCVNAALPWPIEGVQYCTPGVLTALRKAKPPPVLTTGTRATDAVMRLPGEGKLIVVTGIPGHGKTTWVRYVTIHTAKDHDRRWLCFSPENAPWERFLAEAAEVYIGKPFHRRKNDGVWVEAMSDEEVTQAENWLRTRVAMLVFDSQDAPPSLDQVLDRAAKCVLRDGTTDLLIDPWNELEHSRPEKMSETEYTGLCLQRCRAFSNRYRCNVWIIAHPKVQQAPRPGAKLLPPGLYDISGGANWANKADMGICVYTPDNVATQIILLKAKFRRWGTRNAKAIVSYDTYSSRYTTPRVMEDTLTDNVEENAK
jgi:twinkle protein